MPSSGDYEQHKKHPSIGRLHRHFPDFPRRVASGGTCLQLSLWNSLDLILLVVYRVEPFARSQNHNKEHSRTSCTNHITTWLDLCVAIGLDIINEKQPFVISGLICKEMPFHPQVRCVEILVTAELLTSYI